MLREHHSTYRERPLRPFRRSRFLFPSRKGGEIYRARNRFHFLQVQNYDHLLVFIVE